MYNFRTFELADVRGRITDFLDMIVPRNNLSDILSDKNIVAYGCGDLGRMCREFCDVEKFQISAYVDANYENVSCDAFWQSEKVQPLEYLQSLDKEKTLILVCVVTVSLADIFKYLNDLGFKNVMTFYDFAEQMRCNYPLQNGWLANPENFDKNRLYKTISYLKDTKSVAHYLSFIAWRFAREEWLFKDHGVNVGNRFMIDEVIEHLSSSQVLVDIGAHIGSVSIRFNKHLKQDLKRIICFEPDEKNRTLLRAHLTKEVNPISKFEVFEDVLWSNSKDITFSQGHNYASCIDTIGDIRTPRMLDSFNLEPTIIKIHTEGSELDIVKGGLATIQKNRPIIMLTVYHNEQGIYETLEYLKRHLIDYDLIFRNHSWAGTGAVVYCLPEK
ncbi:FkbM family methyltransferase [Lentilitoribacter sp. Alg239-R112]|uniref:FkbM family methyltransferase n=1 Tax=Lentilitoribacter sp. Alg239-R112 TaxID=2305987 RepID=UPI0013A70874|nr:FkbM family methyltransferase [Lentilitoribacter sp. Alg239-R112]